MRTIAYIDGSKTFEYHMSAGKGMKLNEKLGMQIFSLSSEKGLFQICGLDPEGGYKLFMAMLNITDVEELDKFNTDQIWQFLEGCFADFFPPRIRPHVPEFLQKVQAMAMEQIQKMFSEPATSPTAPSNSATGSPESLAASTPVP